MKHGLIFALTTLALTACQTIQSTQTNPNSRTGIDNTVSAANPSDLTTIWALRQLNGKVIDKSQFPRRVPYLDVNIRDAHVIGSTGCNRFTGSFAATGNTVKIGPLASTKMACADGMSVENEFLTALQNADSYRINGKELTLFRGDSALMLLGRGD